MKCPGVLVMCLLSTLTAALAYNSPEIGSDDSYFNTTTTPSDQTMEHFEESSLRTQAPYFYSRRGARVLVCREVDSEDIPFEDSNTPFSSPRPSGLLRPLEVQPGKSRKVCKECVPMKGAHYVCASDGAMYSSVCSVNYLKCKGEEIFVTHQAGLCGYWKGAPSSPCDYECPLTDAPVCGSGGSVTYTSLCHLEKEAGCVGREIKVVREGPCEEPSHSQCPLVCPPYDSREVCGSDGITYGSQCLLKSARVCHGRHVYPSHFGPCERDGECPRSCPVVRAPVCGSDNLTYINPCFLRAATCRGSGVRFVRSGPCESSEQCLEDVCQNTTEPVCGSDGKTYPSECHVRRANQCQRVIVSSVHKGPCPTYYTSLGNPEEMSGPERDTSCCRDNPDPVCGSDGHTYTNICFLTKTMECEKRFIAVLYPGPCAHSLIERHKEMNQCPPPLSMSVIPCPFRQDTCFSWLDCNKKDELCCSDGCSFHCTVSMRY